MMQFATTSYKTVSKLTANQFQVEKVYYSTISDFGIPSSSHVINSVGHRDIVGDDTTMTRTLNGLSIM